MKRLIIPDHLLRELCKVDGKIYSARRKSDTVHAAIQYVAGWYLYQGEAAEAYGVTRASVNSAVKVITKSWQKNRVAVLSKWLQSGSDDDMNSNCFVLDELAAIAAGIDTSNGLFDPLNCDDSAFKLSAAPLPDVLEVWGGMAKCKKTFDGREFYEIINIDDQCDELTALRAALFSVAVDVGMHMLTTNQKEPKNAGNN